MNNLASVRVALAVCMLATLSACSRTGLNAGEQGGRAFVALTVMLLVTLAILWAAIGRER